MMTREQARWLIYLPSFFVMTVGAFLLSIVMVGIPAKIFDGFPISMWGLVWASFNGVVLLVLGNEGCNIYHERNRSDLQQRHDRCCPKQRAS